MRRLLIAGGVLAVLLAAVVSYYASSLPDGLNKVAADHGIAASEKNSATVGSPLADYSVQGLSDDRTSNALAGLAGVAITGVAGFGLFYILKGRRT